MPKSPWIFAAFAALFLFNLRLRAQNWVEIQGIKAQDVGAGLNGTAWITATDGRIFRWENNAWKQIPGGAVRVAVNPQGVAWVVNAGKAIWRYNPSTNDWTNIPGAANDIAIGANGKVWIIGNNTVPGGFDIYRRDGEAWTKIPGGALRIAVDANGNPWVLNNSNTVFEYDGRQFVVRPGRGKDIGAGLSGDIWMIGMADEILKWSNGNWVRQSGAARQISVGGPQGNAWVVNSAGQVFRSQTSASGEIPININPGNLNIPPPGSTGGTFTLNQPAGGFVVSGPLVTNIPPPPAGTSGLTSTGGTLVTSSGPQYTSPNVEATAIALAKKLPFTRHGTMEEQMLKAMGFFPYTQTLSNFPTSYDKLDHFGQAMGTLGLQAAEIYFAGRSNITAGEALQLIKTQEVTRKELGGILAMLVMTEINRNGTSPQALALKKWGTDLFRSVKILTAKGMLDEYQKWNRDPCAYEGLTEAACKGKYGVSGLISAKRPPQDLIAMNGMGNVLGQYRDAIGSGVTLGLSAATVTAAAIATAAGLSTVTTAVAASSLAGAAGTMYAGATSGVVMLTTQTGLFGAFGGASTAVGSTTIGGGTLVGTQTVASGAIGATSWAGVIAAPVAAAILAVVVGTIEGFAVVEAARVEPMMKLKLGAAMTEDIVLANAFTDSANVSMFYLAFQRAALDSFRVPVNRVNGEVRFFNQGGYDARFALEYTVNGRLLRPSSNKVVSIGQEQILQIPYNATAIRASGQYMKDGNWLSLFTRDLPKPTYIGFTSYGTIWGARVKDQYPEISNIIANPGEFVFTQGGGYSCWVRVTYTQNGQQVTALDKSDAALGFRQVFNVPGDATNIHLQAWSATGWVGEPWKSIIDKIYPLPPNECIKVYGTALEPKWNNECE